MNRFQTTATFALLAAISSCGDEAADTYISSSLNDMASQQLSLITPPQVNSLQGALCGLAGGCELTVAGRNFRAGFVQVFVNGKLAPCHTVTVTKLVCTIPAAAGATGAVALEVANAPGDPTKSWKQADGFFYVAKTVAPWPLRTLRTKGVPIAAAVADLNQDGYPDIAVISQNRDAVEVFLGQPDHRTFSASVEVPVGKNPSALLAGNFNTDPQIELAVANTDSNTLTMLWSNVGSPYTARTTSPVIVAGACVRPNSLVSADQNGDGVSELVMGCVGSPGTISFLPVAGDLAYADSSRTPAGTTALNLAHATGPDSVFDLIAFNGDLGRAEIRNGRRSEWPQFENSGPAVAALVGRSISAIAAGYINHDDTRTDLVALDGTGKELLLMPSPVSGANFSVVSSRLAVRDAYKKLALIDVDNDSFQDIVATLGASNTADIYRADHAGGFTKHQELNFGFAVPRAELGDVDGDHLPELLLLGANTPYTADDDDGKAIHIIANQGGKFNLPSNFFVSPSPIALLTTNLDTSDATAELVALSSTGTVTVIDETTTGGFTARPTVELKDKGTLVAADAMALSTDETTLAVLHSAADTFSTLNNDGKGTLTFNNFYPSLASGIRSNYMARDIAMGDFVGGGTDEILITFWSEPLLPTPRDGYLDWYKWDMMTWKGSAKPISSYGKEPLGLVHVSTGRLPAAYYVNSGSDTIGSWIQSKKPETVNTGKNPTALTYCELNPSAMMMPDRLRSVVSAETAANTVTVHLLDSMAVIPPLAVCAQPAALWCGDINADKTADLVVACNSDGSTPPFIELYYGDAKGGFLREDSRIPRPGVGPVAVIAGSGVLRSIVSAAEGSGSAWVAFAPK